MKKLSGLKRSRVLWPVLGTVLLMASGALWAKARKPLPLVNYNTWIVYWDHGNGEKILEQSNASFEHVCVFAYHFDGSHALVPAEGWAANPVSTGKTKRLITAVNDVETPQGTQLKDPGVVDDILSSADKKEKHIQELLKIAESADGIDIDYENMHAGARAEFSSFIHDLADRLHKQGKILTVVSQPKTDDAVKNGAGAIDWKEIGKSADMVKIMAYYHAWPGGEPGPMAPPDWTLDVAQFAQSQIPHDKVCIALTLQGIDWPDGSAGKMVLYEKAAAIARDHNAKIVRQHSSASPTFTYRENGKVHTVWFEDKTSLQKKIDVLRANDISHIAFWYLGAGERPFWDSLSETAATKKTVESFN